MFATPAWWFSPGSFGIGDVTAALARQDELELALMASQLGHDEAMSRLDPRSGMWWWMALMPQVLCAVETNTRMIQILLSGGSEGAKELGVSIFPKILYSMWSQGATWSFPTI